MLLLEFWSKVISDFNSVSKSEPKILSHHIQRGIPPSLRGMVWQLLAKSKNLKLEEQYMQLLKEESVYEKAIARDLPRACFNINHDQEALFNVVKAYSLYDTDVGYNQSILHITAPLLLNVSVEYTNTNIKHLYKQKKFLFHKNRCPRKKHFVYWFS